MTNKTIPACIFVTTLMVLGSWRGSIFVMMWVISSSLNHCSTTSLLVLLASKYCLWWSIIPLQVCLVHLHWCLWIHALVGAHHWHHQHECHHNQVCQKHCHYHYITVCSVGLCVDFCAHIVHGFLTSDKPTKGMKNILKIKGTIFFCCRKEGASCHGEYCSCCHEW